MLKDNKKAIIEQIVSQFSQQEIIWSVGYLSALIITNTGEKGLPIAKLEKDLRINLIYVTETGNTKFLATELAKILKKQGFKVKINDAAQYNPSDLEKESHAIFFVSTHGEGEIPDSGKKLHSHLEKSQNKLANLNYGIIALGDKNYQKFCQSGKDFDNILQNLEAKRFFDSFLLDLDFENYIDEIAKKILQNLSVDELDLEENTAVKNANPKKNYVGTIKNNIILNDEGSVSQTHHIEIESEEEIFYETGDAIAILFDGGKKDSPRLYSVASYNQDDPNKVNILAKLVKYKNDSGAEKLGLCSSYLSGLKIGDKITFYVAKNRQFKLPQKDKDIIMIGAGTGVAPFLGFMAQRDYEMASGKNWLFFGERNSVADFYYQTIWQDYYESGLLNKIDLAFSRDQRQKIYVQDKILAQKDELFSWLDNGAYIYICGDKKNMAKSVESAIKQVLSEKLGEKSEQYWQNILSESRFLLDVY